MINIGAEIKYTNKFQLTLSDDEVIINFAQENPNAGTSTKNQSEAEEVLVSSVAMTKSCAKSLIAVLTDCISQQETGVRD